MPNTRYLWRQARDLLIGPQLLAFVPAASLCAYWFGGEMLLLVMALILPATLALVSLLNPAMPGDPARDSVTGLPLASHVAERLDQHFAGGAHTRVGAYAIEIDDHDGWLGRIGTPAMDDLLREIADRLCTALRPGDLVARKPGAGFVAMIGPERALDLETMIQIGARLQAVLDTPVLQGGAGLHLSLSIGFCLPRRRFEMCGEGCLSAAETALNEAQAAGPGSIRAYVPRTPHVITDTGGLRQLTAEVATAFDQDEMVPWFQPQLCSRTAQVSGIEALVRWVHPDRGVVEPAQFLGAVSAARLHRRLSDTMLRKGLTALAAWDAQGTRIPTLSINFSQQDLADPLLAERIQWELDRTGLAPQRLAVEVLETVFAGAEDDTVARTVGQLADMGCRIELDDFGTGHAAIANIRRFRVSRIKIDRSFVTRIDIDSDQRTLFGAILDMAGRLGVETIAEGVETEGERALLAQLGCDHLQGYSIARPMPFDRATDWLLARPVRPASGPVALPRTG